MTCRHDDTVPVQVHAHDCTLHACWRPDCCTPAAGDCGVETVAHLCLGCDTALPANWGCRVCEWVDVDVRVLCEPLNTPPLSVCTRPCKEHQ